MRLPDAPVARRPAGWLEAAARGWRGRCPACGHGRAFGRFLKVADSCNACGAELHHHRADDLPPYLVIFLVGHLVGYGILVAETRFEAPLWVHMALWPALTLLLCLALLQPMKGAVVGLQYALGMHGFGDAPARPGAADAPPQEHQGETRLEPIDGAGPRRPIDGHRA